MDYNIKMVDLFGQYEKIKSEVDQAIQNVIDSSGFINGAAVSDFAQNLAAYSGAKNVVPTANGTDALQIAYLTLGLQPGDEVIMPSFNYVASAEAASLLKLKPVFVDVHEDTFNINENLIEEKITSNTKAIVAVHLFGQSTDMESIMKLAEKYHLFVIEDNAQALGATYQFKDKKELNTGTIGHINTTSFFPTKNLGCFGDGGAIFTNDEKLAKKSGMISKHGQKVKYEYELIGCNSRLDTLQAAILNVKLKYLDDYAKSRQRAAKVYDDLLINVPNCMTPIVSDFSTHVFHQYVIKLKGKDQREVQKSLKSKGIPSMIYYHLPLHLQNAYAYLGYSKGSLPVSESLSKEVLALPMHTELTIQQQEYIVSQLKEILK